MAKKLGVHVDDSGKFLQITFSPVLESYLKLHGLKGKFIAGIVRECNNDVSLLSMKVNNVNSSSGVTKFTGAFRFGSDNVFWMKHAEGFLKYERNFIR